MTDGEKELPPTFGMTEELSTDEVNKGRKHYLEMCRERDAKLKIYRDKRKARELKKIDAIRADQEAKTRREIEIEICQHYTPSNEIIITNWWKNFWTRQERK